MDLIFSQHRFSELGVQVVEAVIVADKQVVVLGVASGDLAEQIVFVVADSPVAGVDRVVDPAVDNEPVAVYLVVDLGYSGCLDLLGDSVY